LVLKNLASSVQFKFLLLFLSFPASFYLLANYTESLFIFLLVSFFVLLKTNITFWPQLLQASASGTRLVGAFLLLTHRVIVSQKLFIHYSALSQLLVSGFCYLFYAGDSPLYPCAIAL
jgi:hypothetical protein